MAFAIDHRPLPVATTTQAERLAANCAYFDTIISHIPAQVYFGDDDEHRDVVLSKYAKVRFARERAGRGCDGGLRRKGSLSRKSFFVGGMHSFAPPSHGRDAR